MAKILFKLIQFYNKLLMSINKLIYMLPPLQKREKSITETLSPTYRKLSGLNSKTLQYIPQTQQQTSHLEALGNDYKNLQSTIDNLQVSLDNRMSVHERELLDIMKIQIEKMLQEVRKVVNSFNQMIKEKNFSEDLWETRNQVQYFKFEAVRLFQENKNLRKEISVLRKQLEQYEFYSICQVGALKNMAKKLAKSKAERNALSASLIGSKQQNCETVLKKRKHKIQFSHSSKKQKVNSEEIFLTPLREKQDDFSTDRGEIFYSSLEKKTNLKTDMSKPQLKTQQSENPQSHSEKIIFLNNPIRNNKILKFKQKLYFPKKNSLNPEQKQPREVC